MFCLFFSWWMNDVTIKRRKEVFCFMISHGLSLRKSSLPIFINNIQTRKIQTKKTESIACKNSFLYHHGLSKQINWIKTPLSVKANAQRFLSLLLYFLHKNITKKNFTKNWNIKSKQKNFTAGIFLVHC